MMRWTLGVAAIALSLSAAVASADTVKVGLIADFTGVFGANMQVLLVNDGPVTFWLET